MAMISKEKSMTVETISCESMKSIDQAQFEL